MKRFNLTSAIVFFATLAAGCASDPVMMPLSPTPPTAPPRPAMVDPQQHIKTALGMGRAPADLGYSERRFNPCSLGLSDAGGCHNQYLSVVHFQLLCRDTEGTVSAIPAHLRPIVADSVRWSLADQTGGTQTDENGYGQFSVLSSRSVRGKRLILRIGPQFVAFDVSEVSRVVLPKNFCHVSRYAAN